MVTEFKVTVVNTRCRSVHARGFTAGQKNFWKISTGLPDRWAVAGRLLAKPVLECSNFPSYRFPSPDGKVLGQMTRGQVCWLAL